MILLALVVVVGAIFAVLGKGLTLVAIVSCVTALLAEGILYLIP